MAPMADPLVLAGVSVQPPVVLAPMAGVTSRPFRRLCRRLGAGMVCGEMVSGRALAYTNPRTAHMLELAPDEHPVSLQVAAGVADVAASSVKELVRAGADVIDLNMGCPVPKVRRSGAGAILMTDPARARAIMEAAVAAAGDRPVTVKIRAGWDEGSVNFVRIAEEAVEAGCAGIALHARTAAQMYGGQANWEWIAELVRSVPLPVIGSGDVRTADDCLRMLEETQCAAVMIGRAAQGDPWVFERCAAAVAGEPAPAPVGWRERLATAYCLCEELVGELGERRGCLQARRTLSWFGRGMPEAAQFRERAHQVTTLTQVRDLLRAYGVPLAD